jgi:hypothetical protein
MSPSAAETARTLARGRLLGAIHVRAYPSRLRVRHATPADGHPLLLTRTGGELATALAPPPGEDESAALVLSVDDVPPVAGAPSRGRLWLSGYAKRLDGDDTRAAAQLYAEINPTGDLLDLGRGYDLFRLEAADVRLANGDKLTEVDVDDYLDAAPDPVADDEERLLADLNDHHRDQLAELVARTTGAEAPESCRAVRLDRYGLVVAPGPGCATGQRLRLGFPHPVASVCELTHLVHALLFQHVEATP